jgi:hypothetical protein
LSEPRGVQRIEGKIVSYDKHENGDVHFGNAGLGPGSKATCSSTAPASAAC